MSTTHHLSQSVRGPLINWSDQQWREATEWITRKDGKLFTVRELKAAFCDHLAAGHEVIPMGDCDNFDYKDGCKGHPDNEPERSNH